MRKAPRTTDRSAAGNALTEMVLRVFRLNGMFLAAAETIAEPSGLTAAWWQVIGAVLDQPRSVADAARHMGLARQGVQRIADLLVDKGLARYEANPVHRRAKLLAPAPLGRKAIERLRDRQHAWADRIAAQISAVSLAKVNEVLAEIKAALERDEGRDKRADPVSAASSATSESLRRRPRGSSPAVRARERAAPSQTRPVAMPRARSSRSRRRA